MLHTASGWLVTAASDADATAAASVNHEHHPFIVNASGYCPSSFHALFKVSLRGLTSYLVLHTKHMKCVYTANTYTHTHIQCRWVLTAFTVPRQKQPQHRVSVLCVIEGYGFEATGIRPYTHSIYAREHANIHTKQRSSTTLRFYRCTALQLCIAAWQSRIVEWI